MNFYARRMNDKFCPTERPNVVIHLKQVSLQKAVTFDWYIRFVPNFDSFWANALSKNCQNLSQIGLTNQKLWSFEILPIFKGDNYVGTPYVH